MPLLVAFELLETDSFARRVEALDRSESAWLEKIKRQLRLSPFSGKPLGVRWFREKKFENKRLYYLVSESRQRVLLLAFGNKKEQSKLIGHLRLNQEAYLAVLNRL